MKHLKKFNDINVMDDIKDILLELEDVEYTYKYTRIVKNIEDNVITLYDTRLSPFIISDLDDIIGRIEDFLKISRIDYEISYHDENSHYFSKKGDKHAMWHPTTKSIKIIIKSDVN